MSNNQEPYPLLSYLDNVEIYDGKEIKTGYYYVDKHVKCKINGKHIFDIPQTFCPQVLVKFLLKKGFVTKEDIKYQLLCKKLPPGPV